MELLQLRYFCVAVKHENITKAAEELHISQPSLSKTIKMLEDEIGVHLFDRVGKRIRLNRYGELFYKNISYILQNLDDTVQEIKDSSKVLSGSVNLMVIAASSYLPELYANFTQEYPEIKINLVNNALSKKQLPKNFDLCIAATPQEYPHLSSINLFEEELVLAVPADFPLAENSIIDISETADYNFIFPWNGSSIQAILSHISSDAGFTPKALFECDNIYTFVSMLKHGLGIALVPSISMGYLFNEKLVPVKISNPGNHRTIKLLYDQNRYMTIASQTFIDFTVQFFNHIKPHHKNPIF